MAKKLNRKIERLRKQYPHVDPIVFIHSVRDRGQEVQPKITYIAVERADAELLFRRGRGTGPNGWIMSSDRPDQVAQNREFAYLFNQPSDSPREPDMLEGLWWYETEPYFVRDLFRKYPGRDFSMVAWVDQYDWHHRNPPEIRESGSEFGKFIERELRITLYLRPEVGWETLFARANFMDHARLHSKFLLESVLETDSPTCMDYRAANAVLAEITAAFAREVLAKGLEVIIDTSTKRGMSGQFGPVTLMSWVMCGRVVLTFREGDDDFSVIGEEHNLAGNIGWQSVDATLPDVRRMVGHVTRVWKETAPEHRPALYRDDEQVGLLY
ncbi:hypothetical protein HY375_00115 [Candidatus Berkelbacteria bacterium]|nr:hypothetical protein [Candidatus Berkelbacteria bacterium]